MKRLIFSALAILALLPRDLAATEAVYKNSGTVFNPQVDAVVFINEGRFSVTQIRDPYETFSTLHYTNRPGVLPNSGLIEGSPGFFFHTVPPSLGNPRRASSFFNANGAIVRALDPFAL